MTETCPDTDASIGDTYELIVEDANHDRDKDPIARINGKIVFLKYPRRYDDPPTTGEMVRARITGIMKTALAAVVLDRLDDETDTESNSETDTKYTTE